MVRSFSIPLFRAWKLLALPFLLSAPHPVHAGETAFPSTQIFSDPLVPSENRSVGTGLKGTPLAEGGANWAAVQEVSIGERGVTSAVPGGGHHAVRPVAGTIHLQADVSAHGSGFTGMALGRGNLSGDFWKNLSMVFFVTGGGDYNLFVGSTPLIPKRDKSLLSDDKPNRLDLLVDTIAGTVTAKINGKTVLDAAPLPEAARLSAISAAGFRFNEPMTAGQPAVSNYRAEVETKASTGLKPLDYTMTFVDPDKEAALKWKVGSPGPSGTIPYTLRDYTGKPAGEGAAIIDPDGIATVKLTLPRGYYEIIFPEAGQTFGVVSLEPNSGTPDPFFGMDSALSGLEPDPARREGLIKIMARCGIAMSRERSAQPGSIMPAMGKFNWEGSKGLDTIRKVYAENRVEVLEIIGEGGPAKNIPESAFAIGEMSKRWTIWGGAEAGNEPDLKPRPADHYVQLVKTMSYALKQAGSKVPLVSGVFAGIPPGPFFDACVANGMLEDSDVVSFHSYDRAPEVERMVARYREWLKKNGRETLPLWHTECGWSWQKGSERPPVDQDAVSALEITAKAIETRACGVARHFPFVLPFYEEGAKNFSMFGRDNTPLRSMAAYAAAIQFLSGKPYAGDLAGLDPAGLDPAVKLARVFGSGDELVAVLYTGETQAGASVPFPYKIKHAAGADGRALAPTEANLPIPDGIAYVWLDHAGLGENLKTDTEAMRLFKLGQNPLVQERRASPIIIRFLSEKTPSQASARRYLISPETAAELPIHARIYNLSPAEITVTPALEVPGKPPEKSAPLAVPGMGFAEVSWKLDAAPFLDIADTRFLTVSATVENTVPPTPAAIPFVMQSGLEEHLKRHPRQLPLPITELTRWKKNQSSGTTAFSSPEAGVWRADMKFTAGSSWTFPGFQLPEGLDLKSYSGFLIRGRIIGKAKGADLIASSGKGIPSFWVSDLFPADGEWHVVYVPFAEFKPGPNQTGNQNTRLAPELWESLQIGFTHGKENTFEISHLLLVGGGE